MNCPKCHSSSSRVIDSRPADDNQAIRRRRACDNCGHRFTTFERIEHTPLLVIKKNGEREEFKREKIMNGIIRSAEKRPVSIDMIEKVVDQIESDLRGLDQKEISSSQIGEYVMEYLVDLDEISYIRFASVYRQFKDMSVFFKEMQDIVKKDQDE